MLKNKPDFQNSGKFNIVEGTSRSESLHGGFRYNAVFGYAGNDTLSAGSGLDGLFGGDGNDKLLGRNGNDWLDGEKGNDRLYGGSGHDALSGGDGNDYLSGNRGNDYFHDGAGHDTMNGGSGKDSFDISAGDDVLIGGSGKDTYTFWRGFDPYDIGDDIIRDYSDKTVDLFHIFDFVRPVGLDDNVTDFQKVDTNGDSYGDGLKMVFGDDGSVTIAQYFRGSNAHFQQGPGYMLISCGGEFYDYEDIVSRL